MSGRGILDEELIDEVGFALVARCESMLKVREAVCGRPPCPVCGATARLLRGENPMAECDSCGWNCPWKLYQKTYQRKNLSAGGMAPTAGDFVRDYSIAKSPGEKLVLIDTLIHRFHWESATSGGGRPGACNLIEGKMKDIMPFLDRISYGESVPDEVKETREQWRKKWSNNPWSQGKGQ